MSDLRTRIIGVLYDGGDMPAAKAARLADAVIAELGLREERTETEALTNEQRATWFRQGGYRHVTDWRADDE